MKYKYEVTLYTTITPRRARAIKRHWSIKSSIIKCIKPAQKLSGLSRSSKTYVFLCVCPLREGGLVIVAYECLHGLIVGKAKVVILFSGFAVTLLGAYPELAGVVAREHRCILL